MWGDAGRNNGFFAAHTKRRGHDMLVMEVVMNWPAFVPVRAGGCCRVRAGNTVGVLHHNQ